MARPCSLLPLALLLLLAVSSAAKPTVWEVLEENGLPRGLVPGSVTDAELADDGSFVLYLEKPCYVQFEYLVYYDTTISGTIAFGSIRNLKGVQAKALLFLWLDVTGIEADVAERKVTFQIGAISKVLPANQFTEIPTCQNAIASGFLGVVPCGGRGGRLFQQLLLPDV